MKLSEDLKRTRKIIEKPENWTTGRMIQIKNGEVAYCAMGAITLQAKYISTSVHALNDRIRAMNERKELPIPKLLPGDAPNTLKLDWPDLIAARSAISAFNNSFGHEKTLGLFDAAIKTAEENELS